MTNNLKIKLADEPIGGMDGDGYLRDGTNRLLADIGKGRKALADLPEYQFSFLLYSMIRACGLTGEVSSNTDGAEARNVEFEGICYRITIRPEAQR